MMVTVKVPPGVADVVEIVSDELGLAGTFTGFGEKVHIAPVGRPAGHVSATAPENPFNELTGIVYAAVVPPWLTVWLPGEGVPKLKSGVTAN